MTRWLIGIGLVIAALAVLAAGIGLAMPKDHRATSMVSIPRPPQEVWAVVRNPRALIDTWGDLTSAQRVPDTPGQEIWEEQVSGFTMRLIIREVSAPTRMVTVIDAAPDAAFGGHWTYELVPTIDGTTVKVTEEGWVSNPIFRVMMHLGGVHKSIDGYLTALGQHFDTKVTPEHEP